MGKSIIIVFLRFSPLLFLILFSFFLIRFIYIDRLTLRDKLSGAELAMANSLVLEEKNSYSLVAKKENLSKSEEIAGFRCFVSEKITVGREKDNDFVINSPYASGYHAQIEQCGRDLFIEDLNSTNGTYVNGKRIPKKRLLKPGDYIFIGGETLEVEGGGADANSSFIPQRVGKRAK